MTLRVLPVLFLFLIWASAEAQSPTFDDLATRAAAARDSNDVSEAMELYRQALQLNAQWTEGWWSLGTLAYDADRYDMARDALARCIQLQPEMTPARALLGLSEFQTGQYDDALKHIRDSLADSRLEAQMVRVLRFHEAMLLAHAGDFDRAMEKYAWFANDPAPAQSLLAGIGIAALREPLLPDSIPAERRILFEASGRAVWSAMTEDEAHAASGFAELLNRFPSEVGVHVLIGVYLQAAPLGKARAEFERELAGDAPNVGAAAMLACLLLNHNDDAGALPWAAKAVQLAPQFSMAQYAMGKALADTGDVAGGTTHLELAVRLDPGNLENHIALASAYSKAGRTSEARAERSRSIEMSRGAVVHAHR